jgi:competence protein ComEC
MLIVTVCFATGIVLQGWLSRYYGWGVFLCACGLLAVVICRRNQRLVTISLLFSMILAGAVYTHSATRWSLTDINHYRPFYVGERVTVDGVVISDISHRQTLQGQSCQFLLKVQGVRGSDGWVPHSGKILVHLYRNERMMYGDRLRLTGKLHVPYDFSGSAKFSYRRHLNRQGIRFILSVKKTDQVDVLARHAANPLTAGALRVRHFFQQRLEHFFTTGEAGILTAMLLGDRQDFAPSLWGIFQRTGTAHIIAISGLHVGVVAAVLILFVRLVPVSPVVRYVITIVILIFYAVLTGGQPSVVRAVMMVSVFMLGLSLERESQGINALALAALGLFLLNPMTLYNIGFQLSFMCVFFILISLPMTTILLGHPLGAVNEQKERASKRDKPSGCVTVYKKCRMTVKALRNFLIQSALVSLSAWLGSAGLIAYYFEIVTPVSVFANMVVVPLSVAVIALGLGLMMVIPVCPGAAWVFVNCLKLLLNLMVFITAQIDLFPWASLTVKNVTIGQVVGYYLVALTALLLLPGGRGLSGREDRGWFH